MSEKGVKRTIDRPKRDNSDVELRLDTTRGDELGDLEGVGGGGGEHTSKRMGLAQ